MQGTWRGRKESKKQSVKATSVCLCCRRLVCFRRTGAGGLPSLEYNWPDHSCLCNSKGMGPTGLAQLPCWKQPCRRQPLGSPGEDFTTSEAVMSIICCLRTSLSTCVCFLGPLLIAMRLSLAKQVQSVPHMVFADSDGAMECTSLPMPGRRRNCEAETKTTSIPSGSSQICAGVGTLKLG